jgi:hypothetical protein
MKYIKNNIKPLAFIALWTCAGYFFGNPAYGAVVGITVVVAATLFL